MRIRSRVALLGTIAIFTLGISCRPADTSLAEAARNWNNAINAKNVDLITSYFADDSVAFFPRPQPSMSKSVIRDNWTDFFQQKNASHPVTTDEVITSSSGDLGYILGSWRVSYDDEGGHQEGAGKYLAVWRRNSAEQWRIVAISANEYDEPKK
jgi:ketosteroid isomerase-like protein